MSPSWLPSSEAEVRELAPVLCQYGLDPAGIILSRSSLAHTNRVYLVQPAGAPTMVLRVVGETYGATLSKPDHLTLEVETLDYLASVNFRLTPAVLPTVDGTRIAWSGSQPYMLLSFMPGAPAGSFNDLSGLSAPRRERLFWSAGRMSRVLRPFQPTTPVREKTLYQFCRESAHRLATVIARLPEAGQALVVSQSHMLEPFALTTVDELGRSGYDDLPKQIVHTDMHLGQFLFEEDEVSAILDFDWLRWDCVLTDEASVLAMCCYTYGGSSDGLYAKELVQQGVAAFRRGFGLDEYPFSDQRLLRLAFKGYLLFQFLFTCEMYISQPTDENLVDLRHFLNMIVRNDFDDLFS